MGIIGKFLTGPLFRLIEDESTHIFDLNSVWNEVIVTLEDLSKDAKPLLKQQEIVPGGIVTKDEIYEELFKDTDSETESLTEQCLRLQVCSSAILL